MDMVFFKAKDVGVIGFGQTYLPGGKVFSVALGTLQADFSIALKLKPHPLRGRDSEAKAAVDREQCIDGVLSCFLQQVEVASDTVFARLVVGFLCAARAAVKLRGFHPPQQQFLDARVGQPLNAGKGLAVAVQFVQGDFVVLANDDAATAQEAEYFVGKFLHRRTKAALFGNHIGLRVAADELQRVGQAFFAQLHRRVGADGQRVALDVFAVGTAGQQQEFDVKVHRFVRPGALVKQGTVRFGFVVVELAAFVGDALQQPQAVCLAPIDVLGHRVATQTGVDGNIRQ